MRCACLKGGVENLAPYREHHCRVVVQPPAISARMGHQILMCLLPSLALVQEGDSDDSQEESGSEEESSVGEEEQRDDYPEDKRALARMDRRSYFDSVISSTHTTPRPHARTRILTKLTQW